MKNILKTIFAATIISICLLGVFIPNRSIADYSSTANAAYVAKIINATQVAKTIKVVVTAYSSTPDQTDSTPFITASGEHVADGIAANNMLPFGTKFRIPSLYGDKVFSVQDRMASYKSKYHIDIWMPDRTSAINFGVKTTDIEILQG